MRIAYQQLIMAAYIVAIGILGEAQAIPITGSFEGTVTTVRQSGDGIAAPAGVQVGDRVMVNFVYDSDTLGTIDDMNPEPTVTYTTSGRPGNALNVTIGGRTWSSGTNLSLRVTNDGNALGDNFSIFSTETKGFPFLNNDAAILEFPESLPLTDAYSGVASTSDSIRVEFGSGPKGGVADASSLLTSNALPRALDDLDLSILRGPLADDLRGFASGSVRSSIFDPARLFPQDPLDFWSIDYDIDLNTLVWGGVGPYTQADSYTQQVALRKAQYCFATIASIPVFCPTYEHEFSGDALTISVNIELDGIGLEDPLVDTWEKGIERLWGSQAYGERFIIEDNIYEYPIYFDVNFLSPGAGGEYKVTVHHEAGRSSSKNWYTDMSGGMWGNEFQDEMAAHEFGHFLGLYDEYDDGDDNDTAGPYGIRCFLTAPLDAVENELCDGLMGDLRRPVVARYFEQILEDFNNFTGRNAVIGSVPTIPPAQSFSDTFGFQFEQHGPNDFDPIFANGVDEPPTFLLLAMSAVSFFATRSRRYLLTSRELA